MSEGLSILKLTDTEAVLVSAGLSSRGDIRPVSLIDSGIEDDLELDLYKRIPSYPAIMSAGEDDAATPLQSITLKALKTYAKWFCAALVCMRWNAIAQLASDGKTRRDRFDRMDLSLMQANAEKMRDKALATLVGLLPDLDKPVTRVPTLFGLSSPTTDPVTDLDPLT